MTNSYYGRPPVDLGFIDVIGDEMMFWLYLPIKMPGSMMRYPPQLDEFLPLISAVCYDCGDHWADRFIYLTAKRLVVTPEYIGNRPGWHSDGYLTDDLNYIWYDSVPTLFAEQPFTLSPYHRRAMEEMADQVCMDNIRTYPTKHLLRLDETVIHNNDMPSEIHVRTFVKISVSKHRYNMRGNSRNHLFDYPWEMVERDHTRNTTSTEEPAQ